MTRREMMARMDAQEFNYWRAFEALEPFGPLRDDSRSLFEATASMAAQGGGKLETEQFFSHLHQEAQPQAPEEVAELLKMTLGYPE